MIRGVADYCFGNYNYTLRENYLSSIIEAFEFYHQQIIVDRKKYFDLK